MTKNTHLVLVVFFILNLTNVALCQNAYYDALKLDYLLNYAVPADRLSVYPSAIPTTHPVTEFCNELYSNTIDSKTLQDILNAIKKDDNTGEFMIDASAMGQQSLGSISSISPSSQTAIIDGIAMFMAERFKEDITTIYIDKFRKRLDSIPELAALFPKTHEFLKSADVFNYRSLGNDFKAAFEEDLKNILQNLLVYIENDNSIDSTLKDQGLYYPLHFTLSLTDMLIKGHHPVEILSYLDNQYKNVDGFETYYDVVHGMDLLQRNLQKHEENGNDPYSSQFENIWLGLSDLRILSSPDRMQLFIALLFRDDTEYFTDNLKIDPANPSKFFKEIIFPFCEALAAIEVIQSKENLNPNDYIQIMSATLGLFKMINEKSETEIGALTYQNKAGEEKTVDIITLMDKIMDLYTSIYSKDYGYVVTNSLSIVNDMYSAGGKDRADIIKAMESISKYGGFMVDIVKSENANEIKEAVKKNVTKFSYLDKRNSLVSLTISAHPGVYVGIEGLSVNEDWKPNIGITAPIGFELMWGARARKQDSAGSRYAFVKKNGDIKYLKGGAWSIFASVFDIGAVFNYRLNDSENALADDITFKQVFSPGLSMNYGFRNSPLTLGLGAQYTPDLRKVTVEGNELEDSNSLRIMLRLSWDIPMVKIFGRKIKN